MNPAPLPGELLHHLTDRPHRASTPDLKINHLELTETIDVVQRLTHIILCHSPSVAALFNGKFTRTTPTDWNL